MTQGERRQKSYKEKLALLVHCFAFTLEEETSQLSLRRTPSDSGGRLVEVEATGATTTGRSSLLAHVLRPESTHAQITHTQTQTQTQNLGILLACPRRQTREHTCPLPKYHLPQYPESKIKKKRIENGALFPKI